MQYTRRKTYAAKTGVFSFRHAVEPVKIAIADATYPQIQLEPEKLKAAQSSIMTCIRGNSETKTTCPFREMHAQARITGNFMCR